MLCKNPYMKDAMPYGCGQCLPCRLNRRRLWTHRLFLESTSHPSSTFATLTYSDGNLPSGMSLVPKDAQDFIKRLRRNMEPLKIRFYLVGEYGETTNRPHYHAALFGFPQCTYGIPQVSARGGCDCSACRLLEKSWGLGNVYNGTLTPESAQYIAGYVTKKMTKNDDPRLNGRHPEFARMSNRPGIGADAMDSVVELLESEYGCDQMAIDGDVPHVLNHGKKKLPLGRYLRSKLREKLGFVDKGTPEEVLQKLRQERIDEFYEEVQKEKFKYKGQKEMLLAKNLGKVMSIESKSKLFSKKEKL